MSWIPMEDSTSKGQVDTFKTGVIVVIISLLLGVLWTNKAGIICLYLLIAATISTIAMLIVSRHNFQKLFWSPLLIYLLFSSCFTVFDMDFADAIIGRWFWLAAAVLPIISCWAMFKNRLSMNFKGFYVSFSLFSFLCFNSLAFIDKNPVDNLDFIAEKSVLIKTARSYEQISIYRVNRVFPGIVKYELKKSYTATKGTLHHTESVDGVLEIMNFEDGFFKSTSRKVLARMKISEI